MSEPDSASAVPAPRSTSWTAMFGIGGAVYLALLGTVYSFERSLLYHPSALRMKPQKSFPQSEEVLLDTSDGEKIVAWFAPPQSGKPIVILFHGNGS